MSAVLSEDGVLSKLKFLGEDEDSELDNDPAARLDAEIVLLSGTLRHLLADLRKLLGGVA